MELEPDFILGGGGTIYTLLPMTDEAKTWAAENLPDDCPALGSNLCIEHRYIGAIVDGIHSDGLTVE